MRITKWQKFWVRFLQCIPFTKANDRHFKRNDPDRIIQQQMDDALELHFEREMRKLRERQEKMSLLRKISKDLDEIKSR